MVSGTGEPSTLGDMREVGVCLRLPVASAGSSQTRRVGAPRGGVQAIHLVAAIMQQEKPRFWTWLDAPGRFHRRAAAAAAPPRSPRLASRHAAPSHRCCRIATCSVPPLPLPPAQPPNGQGAMSFFCAVAQQLVVSTAL